MENVATVPFSLSSSYTVLGTQWIRLTQVEVVDTALKSELADLIDRIYGVTPCSVNASSATGSNDVFDNTGGNTDIFTPPVAPPVEKEEFYTIVKQTFDMPICNMFEDGDYSTKIQAVLSDPFGSYTLRLTNGKQSGKASTVRKIITYTITVAEEVGALLDYPFVPDPRVVPVIEWVDSPVSKTKGRINPEIDFSGGAVNWGERVTGSLSLKYMTQYDEVPVIIFGNAAGEYGQCKAVGFYEGLAHRIDLKPPKYEEPEDDDNTARAEYCLNSGQKPGGSTKVIRGKPKCYYLDVKKYYCECSGKHAFDGPEEKVYVDCPEGTGCDTSSDCEKNLGRRSIDGGYTDRCNERDEYNDREFYKEKCCQDPPKDPPLPKCKERKTGNQGGSGLSNELMRTYRKKYRNIKFVGVRPEDGCGTITYRQSVPQRQCCEFVSDITLDEEKSISVIDDWDLGTVVTSGGKWPKTWTAVSAGLFFDQARTLKTIERYNDSVTVYSTNLCGVATLKVTDGCTELTVSLRSTTGNWEVKEDPYMAGTFDATVQTYAGDCYLCGRYRATFQAYSGKWRATQTYSGQNAGEFGTGSTAENACDGVPDDWRAQADIAIANNFNWPSGEKELIKLETIMNNAYRPPNRWMYQYEQSQPTDIWQFTPRYYGYSHYTYYRSSVNDYGCTTRGWVLMPVTQWLFSTYPKLEEWIC